MNPSQRVASVCAVAAVALAALAASWFAQPGPASSLASQRPAPEAAPDRLVSAPAEGQARQPVACRGCNLPARPVRQL